MRLVYKQTGNEVEIGDIVKTFRGEEVCIKSFDKPHKPAAQGKVCVTSLDPGHGHVNMVYYVSVIGAEWVDREDRQ